MRNQSERKRDTFFCLQTRSILCKISSARQIWVDRCERSLRLELRIVTTVKLPDAIFFFNWTRAETHRKIYRRFFENVKNFLFAASFVVRRKSNFLRTLLVALIQFVDFLLIKIEENLRPIQFWISSLLKVFNDLFETLLFGQRFFFADETCRCGRLEQGFLFVSKIFVDR